MATPRATHKATSKHTGDDVIQGRAQATQAVEPPQATAQQLIYADTAIGVAFGAFTSKITFGFETGPGSATPAFTLVLPTSALKALATGILKQLDAPETYGNLLNAFETGVKPVDPMK